MAPRQIASPLEPEHIGRPASRSDHRHVERAAPPKSLRTSLRVECRRYARVPSANEPAGHWNQPSDRKSAQPLAPGGRPLRSLNISPQARTTAAAWQQIENLERLVRAPALSSPPIAAASIARRIGSFSAVLHPRRATRSLAISCRADCARPRAAARSGRPSRHFRSVHIAPAPWRGSTITSVETHGWASAAQEQGRQQPDRHARCEGEGVPSAPLISVHDRRNRVCGRNRVANHWTLDGHAERQPDAQTSRLGDQRTGQAPSAPPAACRCARRRRTRQRNRTRPAALPRPVPIVVRSARSRRHRRR